MKTYSAMSVPDKRLTVAAYGELLELLWTRLMLAENLTSLLTIKCQTNECI
jgi:hypothetical protein